LYEELLKIVTNLGSPTVLLVGDFMLDLYTYGDAERISPEAPVPVLKVKDIKRSCGGAASVAIDLLTLGAKVTCIGLIGNDQNGRDLKSILDEAGADTSGLLVTDQRPTICKHRLIGLAQHRHQQQLFRIDTENADPIDKPLAEGIAEIFEAKLDDCSVICLQDYNKGLLTNDLCQFLIAKSKDAKKSVLIDPCPSADYSKYKHATAITPNRTETSIAVSFKLENQQDYEKAAAKLAQDLDIENIIITLDKEGAYLRTPAFEEIQATRPRNVYDVTGAGDMVLATLAMALACGCDYKTADQLANITGGIEVDKFGVATVTIEEIINEIISQNRGKTGKVRTIESLLAELNWHRSAGEGIVFTNGCFDVIHRGHIEYLGFCKSKGDIVVLGLNSDKSVKSIKGPDRPINNQFDRAAVLAAMESVDYIVMFDTPDPLDLIKKVKPDILIKGQDWEDKGIVGADFVKQNGGQIIFAPLVEGKSSTDTIEKMKALEEN